MKIRFLVRIQMTDDGWRSTAELEREQTGEVPEIFLPKRIFHSQKHFLTHSSERRGRQKKGTTERVNKIKKCCTKEPQIYLHKIEMNGTRKVLVGGGVAGKNIEKGEEVWNATEKKVYRKLWSSNRQSFYRLLCKSKILQSFPSFRNLFRHFSEQIEHKFTVDWFRNGPLPLFPSSHKTNAAGIHSTRSQ